MQLRQIQADVDLLKKRVAKMALDNTMRGLINDEILPIMEAFMEATIETIGEVRGEFSDLEDAVFDTASDMITPDTAAALITAFQIGLTICDLLAEVKIEDELLAKKLGTAMVEYQRNALASVKHVMESTLDPDEEDPDEEEGDDDEDDQDDEKTPVEIPNPRKVAEDGSDDRNDGDRDSTTAEAEA